MNKNKDAAYHKPSKVTIIISITVNNNSVIINNENDPSVQIRTERHSNDTNEDKSHVIVTFKVNSFYIWNHLNIC